MSSLIPSPIVTFGLVAIFLLLFFGWKILIFVIKSITKASSQAFEEGKIEAHKKHFKNK